MDTMRLRRALGGAVTGIALCAALAAPCTAEPSWDVLAKGSNRPLAGTTGTAVAAPSPRASAPAHGDTQAPAGHAFVARDEPVETLFKAAGSIGERPVVVSAKARKYRVSGRFELDDLPALVRNLCSAVGLTWYADGQAYYIYDLSEVRSEMAVMHRRTRAALQSYLRSAGLLDERFPLRGGAAAGQAFFVSGPPKYVELVMTAARFLDEAMDAEQGDEVVQAIRLRNAFVGDRTQAYRGEQRVIPGVAAMLRQLMAEHGIPAELRVVADPTPRKTSAMSAAGDALSALASDALAPAPAIAPSPVAAPSSRTAARPMSIVAYVDTNTLVLRGSQRQIDVLKKVVEVLDVARRQVELSLWIIDLSSSSLEQLGVRWRAGLQVDNASLSFNGFPGSLATDEAYRLLASITALSSAGKATVVSRPVLLTQENVPAIFDSNRSFYVKLVGERATSLETVTYGTSISVLPKISADDMFIELVLNIEDGAAVPTDSGALDSVEGLPVVGRTQINTIARVEKGQSLLIGGHARDALNDNREKIPLLGDLPFIGSVFRYRSTSQDQQLRLYLIQPRLLDEGEPLTLERSFEGRDEVDQWIDTAKGAARQ